MLLRQIDGKFMHNLASVSSECSEERPVTVHNYEAKARVRLEQLRQSFCVKLVVTEIQ